MVAAWISAETGVGPAMASGSHTDSGSWAALPTAPMKSSAAMAVAVDAETVDAPAVMPVYWIVPNALNVRNVASRKPQSPMRFVTNAFFPAEAFESDVNQYE